MSTISDSEHRRLDAVVYDDYRVEETHLISDPSKGLRKIPRTIVWLKERSIGEGGFGDVYLQAQESDRNAKRALKVIRKAGMKLNSTDIERELMAMIEFSKPKVGSMSYTRLHYLNLS
jgi:hypothetical protein